MKMRIGLYSIFAIALIAGMIISLSVRPVSSEELQAGASRLPWTTQVFEVGIQVSRLSTAIGGPGQLPIIGSWITHADYANIGIFNKTVDLPYICGPGGEWMCQYFTGEDKTSSSLSPIAEYTFINTFKVAFAYEKTDHWIYLSTYEYLSNGELIDVIQEQVFPIGTGYYVSKPSSVAFDQYGNAHIAVVKRNNTNTHVLMYAHETTTPNSSCGPTSTWRCDTIVSASGQMIGQPTIVMNSSNDPRILYYYAPTQALTIAYPKGDGVPGTCGPNDSWRCVSIADNVYSTSDMDMAIDTDQIQPHLAWTYTDDWGQTWVYHAHYVAAGGNCGEDASYRPGGVYYANRWDCHQVGLIGVNVSYKNVSIAVDSDNNPVLAYNADNGNNFDLYVAYGIPGDPYTYQGQKVDGKGISTGLQADISIDKSGRGFIAYIEDREYEPTLKIAFQEEKYVYLPLIKR